MLVGFSGITNLNADWKPPSALPQWLYFCPGGNQIRTLASRRGAKEESSSVCSETCSCPRNKANLTDFKAGRMSQKFSNCAELAAVLLMFTRHTDGGVEKGIVG